MDGRARALRLVSLGFATMFLELLLIRYLAGTIWNLGYFPNLVLMAVFVGMGLGFALHRWVTEQMGHRLFLAAPFAILVLVGFVYVGRPATPGFSQWSADIGGDLYFTLTPERAATTGYAPFIACFLITVMISALISQRTAKVFHAFEPLTAYTLDITGSCCGILLFMAISGLHVDAAFWFVLLMPAFVVGLERPSSRAAAMVTVPLLAAAWIVHVDDSHLAFDSSFAGPREVTWSPYQKVEYMDPGQGAPPSIFVNGISHQAMMSAEQLRSVAYQATFDDRAQRASLAPYKKVLVIGAGSGNDVATALMNGASWIDAVEIDPVIQDLGLRHHPLHPYSDPRTHVTIDDGRAFMRRAGHDYDLIIFALTDSVVKVSGVSQLRLENYIYTEESVRDAFNLLNEHGDLIFYNFYRRPWLIDKLTRMITAATARKPRLIWKRADFAAFVVEKDGERVEAIAETPDAAQPATDDWPFFYLMRRGIPELYMIAMSVVAAFIAMMLGAMQLVAKKAGSGEATPGRSRLRLVFVLMGIAFSLLETKSIIQFSLLFGTTWLNTSLVILAVLISVLAANWTVTALGSRLRIAPVFVLLMAATAIPFIYPLSRLLEIESGLARFIVAALMTFAPVFAANLLFSMAFKPQKQAADLFGWNLFGATLGVVIEYFSMLLGYSALAGIVLVTYALAFVLLWSVTRRGALEGQARS
jgi:spermidine synthase